MVEVILVLNADFRLYRWDGIPWDEVLRDHQIAAVGDYVILKPGKFLIYAVHTMKLMPW